MSGGGSNHDIAAQSVEVYVPSTGQQCKLPDLPDAKYVHSMEAKTVCGGLNTQTTCRTLTSQGTWEETTTLLVKR